MGGVGVGGTKAEINHGAMKRYTSEMSEDDVMSSCGTPAEPGLYEYKGMGMTRRATLEMMSVYIRETAG